jgi:phosphate starvation-inducible protein PhoH
MPIMTHEQEIAYAAMMNPEYKIVMINAKAGTSKTWLAVKAAHALYERDKKELLYTFSPVQEGRLGFLPGELQDKTAPYKQPLVDALLSLGIKPTIAILDPKLPEDHVVNRAAWIKAEPHVFMRGTNKENKTLIIDEAQNWTIDELKLMLTRCHDNTKVIMIGHTGQIDLPNPHQSGFEPYMWHMLHKPWAIKPILTINFRGELAQWADEI